MALPCGIHGNLEGVAPSDMATIVILPISYYSDTHHDPLGHS